MVYCGKKRKQRRAADMEVRILAIGDVVAKSGLELVSRKLRSIKKLTGADSSW